MTAPTFRLSIVLPTYNEEAVIASVVNRCADFARARAWSTEIIVVNDGSTDRTGSILRALRPRVPELRLITHPANRGYGEALRSGFAAARGDWLFLMDSDGQFDIADLDRLLPLRGQYDLILGYRARRADPWHRKILAWGYTTLVNVLFRLRLRDPHCAFKLFRRSVWESVQPIRSTDHKIFTVEWLRNARRRRLRIAEVPVPHYPRVGGRPTGARPAVIRAMLKALFRILTT